MTKSDYLERKINGRRYVLRPHEHINGQVDPDFLGTGLALVCELLGNLTLQDFIDRQKNRVPEVKTQGRPKVENPVLYIPHGKAGRPKKAKPIE